MLKRVLFALVLFFIVSSAQAATYAWINITGRSQKAVDRERQMVTQAIKLIPGAKLIYSHQEKKGWVFKKITLTMFIKGTAKTLNKWLAGVPYQGDNVKEVVMEIKYNSSNNETGEFAGSTLYKRFSNISNAVKFIKEKNRKYFWGYLNKRDVKEYKKHLKENKKLNENRKIELHFYAFKPSTNNHIFYISEF